MNLATVTVTLTQFDPEPLLDGAIDDHGSTDLDPGTYALLPVSAGVTVEADWYWICEYPEFNDPECQSHYCAESGAHPSGGECCHPDKARMPWKHSECGRVWVVRETPTEEVS